MEHLLIFIAVCLGLITFALLALLVAMLYVLWKVRKLLTAVELLAGSAHAQFTRLRDATEKVRSFAGLAGSMWPRVLAVGLGTAAAMWSHRRNSRDRDSGADPRERREHEDCRCREPHAHERA